MLQKAAYLDPDVVNEGRADRRYKDEIDTLAGRERLSQLNLLHDAYLPPSQPE